MKSDDPALPKDILVKIGQQLRSHYDVAPVQPMPPQMENVLRKLHQLDRKKGNAS